jgi:hypothetical protein
MAFVDGALIDSQIDRGHAIGSLRRPRGGHQAIVAARGKNDYRGGSPHAHPTKGSRRRSRRSRKRISRPFARAASSGSTSTPALILRRSPRRTGGCRPAHPRRSPSPSSPLTRISPWAWRTARI